jgi:hypothetical protein
MDASCRRVIHPVRLGALLIVERTIFVLLSKLLQVRLHRLHMHNAPECAQVRHGRLGSMPRLI